MDLLYGKVNKILTCVIIKASVNTDALIQTVDKAASRSIASCAAFLSFFIKYKCKSENKEKMTYY